MTGRLRIHNAQRSDSGLYFCRAWSSGKTMESNEISLRVFASAEQRVVIPTGNAQVPEYDLSSGDFV